jgi:hypothetical protein
MPKDLKKDTNADNAIAVVEPVNTIVIANEDLSGDFEQSDLLIPTIRQVQKTGELAELHAPGSWVLNQEELLSDGVTPIHLTVLTFRKFFAENIPFGDDKQARIAATLAEVREMDGTTEWINDEQPSFIPVGEATLLVEGKNEALFPFVYDDTDSDAPEFRFALARWTMRKTAFARAGRKIITEARIGLQDGLQWGKWELSTGKAEYMGNKWFVPVLNLTGKNDKKFAKWANELGR